VNNSHLTSFESVSVNTKFHVAKARASRREITQAGIFLDKMRRRVLKARHANQVRRLTCTVHARVKRNNNVHSVTRV
jgi:hypothetical protein